MSFMYTLPKNNKMRKTIRGTFSETVVKLYNDHADDVLNDVT